MAALRRILLALWGLVSIAAAAIIAVMLINTTFAQNIYDFLDKCFLYNFQQTFLADNGIWWGILFGIILLILGAFCVIVALMPKPAVKKLRVATVDGGCVDISLSALNNVVVKAASSQQGVDSVDARLAVKNNGLHIHLNIKVPCGLSVTELGAQVRENVNTQLEAIAGIIPADIQVVIDDVIDNKEAAVNAK